jgi:hypothetical protein
VCTRNGCYWIKKEYPRLEYCVSVYKKWVKSEIFFLYSIAPISCTHGHSTRVWDILSLFNSTRARNGCYWIKKEYPRLKSTVSVCTRNGCYWIKKEYPRLEYCVSVYKKLLESGIFFLYSIAPVSCTHGHSTRVWDILSLFNSTHFLLLCQCVQEMGAIE